MEISNSYYATRNDRITRIEKTENIAVSSILTNITKTIECINQV